MNYLTGGGLSKMSPEQLTSMKNDLFTQQDLAKQQLAQRAPGFQQRAPQFAPMMAASGQLPGHLQSYTQPLTDQLKRLDSFRPTAQAPQGTAPASGPRLPAERAGMQGVGDRLSGYIKSLMGGSASAPAAPSAGPPQAAGGFDPDAYLGKKR